VILSAGTAWHYIFGAEADQAASIWCLVGGSVTPAARPRTQQEAVAILLDLDFRKRVEVGEDVGPG
jgi:hypothetical protein